MAIVRTDVPMTSALCGEIIQQLVAAYPTMRTEVLTTTAFGRPVQTLSIGDGPRKVLFSASHHANEWITTPVILRFMEELAEAARTGGTIYGPYAQTEHLLRILRARVVIWQNSAQNMGRWAAEI